MTIENTLKMVVRRTKNTFQAGTSTCIRFDTKNIINTTGESNENTIVLNHLIERSDKRLGQMRKDINQRDVSYCHHYYTINKFERKLTGNCHELAEHTFHELIKFHSLEIFNFYRKINKNPIYIVLCATEYPSDHVFVMIHHADTNQHLPPFDSPPELDLFSLFKELKSIHPTDWICDPWADIVCKGQQYPFEWQKKMHSWYSDNCYVRNRDSLRPKAAPANTYNELYSPLRKSVINMITPSLYIKPIKIVFIHGDTGQLYQLEKKRNKIIKYDIS
jgi:hypothetical protein